MNPLNDIICSVCNFKALFGRLCKSKAKKPTVKSVDDNVSNQNCQSSPSEPQSSYVGNFSGIILFPSKGTNLEEHKDILLKILNILECVFFEKDMKWLIFKISNKELKPFFGKADSIKNLSKPQNKHFGTKVFLLINKFGPQKFSKQIFTFQN